MMDKLFKKIEDIEYQLQMQKAQIIDAEYQLQMQKAQIIELQAERLSQRRCEDPPDTLRAMEYELRFWQDQRNLPHTSANEVDMNLLSSEDQAWLQLWIDRWDYHTSDWHIAKTGGGCSAWRLDLTPTTYILITNGDLSHEVTDYIEIGVYKDDECVAFKEFMLQIVTMPKSTDK